MEVYLKYELEGIGAIVIYASSCFSQIDDKLSSNVFRINSFHRTKSIDTIQTSKTPREVLVDLENLIIKAIGRKSSHRDPLEGINIDNKERYKGYPRHFGFSTLGWPKRGESQEESDKRIRTDPRNTIVHKKAYLIYREYIKAHH